MKKIKIIIVSILIANCFWSCEKDDICEAGTPTTPNLIIEFYDNLNAGTKKPVTNLNVIADGNTTILKFDGVSKIQIPLKTNIDLSQFKFTLNATVPITSNTNEDIININYTRENVYISRACGFKTVFKLNESGGIVQPTDPNKWIKEIVIQKYNILNENEIHVKIFF